MADKEILQRGTVPTVNTKGVRVASRPMNDDDRATIDGTFGPTARSETLFERTRRERERQLGADGTYSEPGNSGSSTRNPDGSAR